MPVSAQNQPAKNHQKTCVLITDVGSFLGAQLAQSLLAQNCTVYGVGHSHRTSSLLKKADFTLCELEFNQPLPAHLPKFDLIFYFISHWSPHSLSAIPTLSPILTDIIAQAKARSTKVVIIAPIIIDRQFFDYLTKDENVQKFLKLFLVGDLYGPGMDLSLTTDHLKSSWPNELGNLIAQALKTDKVILESEGLNLVYPAYITDITFAINKFVFTPDTKNVQILICEPPQTALTAVYEIHNVARIVLGKELGLFFAGPQAIKQAPEANIKINHLAFSPKVKLDQGLKNTFEYFASQPTFTQAQQPQLKSHQQPVPHSFQLNSEPSTMSKLAQLAQRGQKLQKLPTFKRTLFFLLIIFLLVVGKTGLDIYWGTTNLKKAKEAIVAGQLAKAQEAAQKAQSSWQQATSKTKVLLWPFAFIVPQKIQSLLLALDSLATGSSALTSFAQGSEVLLKDLAIITAYDSPNDALDFDTPAAQFKKAYFQAAKAEKVVNLAAFGPLSEAFTLAQKSFSQLNQLSLQAFELTNLIDEITGTTSPKTYLVLLQNNTELRPGGGFIGNFALVEFADGRLKKITVEDIYTIDGQLQEKIEPPPQLKEKLGLTQFYLRDSNWSGDFTLNAATARDFFKKETAKNVDGVIAVDLTLIQNILAKVGPVKLVDYEEEITAGNLFERGEYYSEVGFFPGSTAKRDFFGSLSRTLISQILESFSANQSGLWLGLLEVFKNGLDQKRFLVTFDDPTLASYITVRGANHPLPPSNFDPAADQTETRDFLAVVEANLGANKVNRFLKRAIAYEMTIGRDADLVARLQITYINESQAETWPAGKYLNFLRVYVPAAASLFEYRNGDQTDPATVETTTQGNLTVFATFVEVPIKSTHQVSFSYRLPKNIKLETAPTYHLYVQKQAGTEKDPLQFKFNLPAYLSVKSVNGDNQYASKENLTLQTDLATDRQFLIELAKK